MKFGKKVNYDNKQTSEDLLQTHLQQMRENLMKNKIVKDQQKYEEINFLNKMETINKLEQQKQMNSKNLLKDNFVLDNDFLRQTKKQRDYDIQEQSHVFFPFVGSDTVEKNRHHIGE